MIWKKVRERAKRMPFWLKTGILATVLMVAGWIFIGGICPMVWRVTHKEETEDAKMRRLVEQLGARETEIRILADVRLYSTHRRAEAKRELLAHGKRAVPFLIEGLHHENGYVRRGCADLLIDIPTREGIAALIRCFGEKPEAVPLLSDIHISLAAITGYNGGLGYRMLDETVDDWAKARQIWEKWWEDYKDRLVETPSRLAVRRQDGTLVPLPITWSADPP